MYGVQGLVYLSLRLILVTYDCFIDDLEFFLDTLQVWIIGSFMIERAFIEAFMRPGGFDTKGAWPRYWSEKFFVYNALVMHFKIWESFVELKQKTERTIVCYNYLIRIIIYECNDFNSYIVFLKIH